MKSLVVMLERSRLTAVDEDQVFSPLVFPPEVVNAMEVKNSKQLAELVGEWMGEQKIEGRKVTLLVSEELVFKHAVAAHSDKSEIFAEQQKFREMLPFHPQDLVIVELPSTDKEKNVLLAVNGELCREITEALEGKKNKVEQIIPGGLVGVAASDALTPAEIRTVLKLSHDLPASVKLRQRLPQPAPEKNSTNAGNTKKSKTTTTKTTTLFGLTLPLWVAWMAILVVFIVSPLILGGAWFWSQRQQAELSQNTADSSGAPVSPEAASLPSASPDTTLLEASNSTASAVQQSPSASEKSQLTITILNGSGVAGQAGLVRDALTSEGYPTATTGNAPAINTSNTSVSFQASVSATVRADVLKILGTIFTEVSPVDPDATVTTQIHIVTGQ